MDIGEVLLGLGAQFFAAGAIYGAIRSDLKSLKERVAGVKETADTAHARIDGMLLERRHR